MHIIQCPYCSDYIIIEQINCQIFRHGEYKDKELGQLPPHSSESVCNDAFNTGLIYGCGKPFRFDGTNVTKCDYI